MRRRNLSDSELLNWVFENCTLLDNGCLVWKGQCDKDGYGKLWYKGSQKRLHRIVYGLCKKWLTSNILLRHSCDNPPCCNPDHLLEGSHQDNKNDSVERKRHSIGEMQGTSVLTESEVLEIRRKYIPWLYSLPMLAEEYNVTFSTIYAIIIRKLWSHI